MNLTNLYLNRHCESRDSKTFVLRNFEETRNSNPALAGIFSGGREDEAIW